MRLHGDDGGMGQSALLGALESLRGLSESRLESVSADEAAAHEAVKSHLSRLESCVGTEVVSTCMALFTLGCRNGLSLCGTVDMVELSSGMYIKWYAAASGVDAVDYAAGAALNCAYHLSFVESGPKVPSESRGPLEQCLHAVVKTLLDTIGKLFTEQRAREIFTGSMRAGILSGDDVSLACGCSVSGFWLGYMFPASVSAADEAGVFSSGLTLYHRVEPVPLGVEWWSSTCDVVDVTSARRGMLWTLFTASKRLSSASQSSWWSELRDRAIGISKMNASAGLSERDMMSAWAVVYALGIVAVAAQDESQHEMLLGSGIMDALEYGILHDFAYMGNSVAASASGAAVALVGRNEGGKVLRREAVHAVLERLHVFFQSESFGFRVPVKSIMPHVSRVVTMAVSDANKKNMLQFEALIDMLLQCLILDDDNHRKGQDGADALQEASAGVLHELSLYGPGAAALRSHGSAIPTLHKLCKVGTKASKERGAAALFELEDEGKRVKRTLPGVDDDTATGQKLAPPHVMVSYNWDHQHVILRVVGSLQARGYLVWIDTEQMKGATVDTMALAVEGSALVLIGVSRAYKESSNCRMEAQYALQKKKPLVPLMLTQGYEADGWLGLLLGTSMWYAFHGETMSSDAAFEGRVDALCREIGVRGRGDQAVASASAPGVTGIAATAPSELSTLKMSVLRKRAKTKGADDGQMDLAADCDDERGALIELIALLSRDSLAATASSAVQQERLGEEDQGLSDEKTELRKDLGVMKMSELRKRAHAVGVDDMAMEDAADGEDERRDLTELLLQALILEPAPEPGLHTQKLVLFRSACNG
jgi:hypothetical protein